MNITVNAESLVEALLLTIEHQKKEIEMLRNQVNTGHEEEMLPPNGDPKYPPCLHLTQEPKDVEKSKRSQISTNRWVANKKRVYWGVIQALTAKGITFEDFCKTHGYTLTDGSKRLYRESAKASSYGRDFFITALEQETGVRICG